MSSLVQPKPGSAPTGYPGSKIQTRNRRPVRVNYPLKKQFASVNSLQLNNNNISRVASCNSWYPSTHSTFNSFHALREQSHQARPFINGASSSYYGSYHADEYRNSDAIGNILIPVFGIGGVLIMFVWGSERIPYSGRIHLNFLPRDLERKYGEFSFNYVKKTLKGKILPQTHWKNVRVRVIANDIIEALRRGLGDDKRVQDSSGEAKKGSKVATYLLEGLDWETLVGDEPIVNAY
ncbi:uncharacterized protein LOC113272261 [Papaver somniferum]|uniref:uncharacterized protein LOC113272261 n=1 Tax=Papaver somniferum TaxID=3469 RepID=UPI000E7009CA|nr:uncharacterized protein LOC113272261 [Papaver somniferum]